MSDVPCYECGKPAFTWRESPMKPLCKACAHKWELPPEDANVEYVNEALESEEFYSLMQAYRTARLTDIEGTLAAFEAVKRWIRNL